MNRIALQQCLRARAVPRLPRATAVFQRSFATAEASSETQKRYVAFDSDISPALEPVLTDIQNKVILPSYISPQQRKRIFDPKLAPTLKNNPVFIEIDDIYHRFEATPLTSIPKTVKTLKSAAAAMETPRDFDQLNRLLAGLTHAGRAHRPDALAAVSRILAAKGQLPLLLEAARQVRRTGFHVGSAPVLHTLLTWTQLKAVDAGWERGQTEQALKWARHLLEMSALDSHKFRSKHLPAMPFPLHRDPIALASPLHLAAALAVGHEGGHDVGGVVAFYARQLVHVWPRDKGYLELYPAEALALDCGRGGLRHISSPKSAYTTLSLALHGFRLASQVVEPQLAQHLDAIATRLDADLAVIRTDKFSAGLEEGSVHKKVHEALFDASGAAKLDVRQAEPAPAVEEEEEAVGKQTE